MFFTKWLRRPVKSRPTRAFRPSVSLLEDRIVPSGFGEFSWWWHSPPAGPATQLEVSAPHHVQSGSAFYVEVEALDANMNVATGYTGTVHFTLANTDAGASLPADYTFTAADNGEHFFKVTLAATGSQTITATDTVTSSITGSADTMVRPAPVATSFAVFVDDNTHAGVPTRVVVSPLDASGNILFNYTGTVTLTSSDSAAVLPASYTFTPWDFGFHTFHVTFNTPGSETITATDTNNVTGSATTTVHAAPVADHLVVHVADETHGGVPANVTVTAVDASGDPVPNYTGTVTLTSSDMAATLPASFTFGPGDFGFHVFQVTFNTAGPETVTATDQNSLHGTDDTQVLAAPVVDHFMVELPSATPAGVPTNVTVIAVDASGHRVRGYTGTVTLTSSDMAAVLPASFTFSAGDNGRHTFQVTFNTVGGQTVTATDTNSVMGIGATLVQAAPVADHLIVHVPDNAPVGVPVNVTVVVVDKNGRLVPNYTGTVAITSSDMAAVLPANFTFSSSDMGRHVFQVTFNTPSDQTVTATDTTTATITGHDTVTVHAVGVVTHFGLRTDDFALPGVPTQVKVVALDANDQVVAGYTGTVHFTSSDGSAVLPADYTFLASDHGSHTFMVTFNTTGPQTLTATDTVTSSLTGQTQVWVVRPFRRFDPFFTLSIVP